MTKSPAFQFYPKDWLSSPRILMMTPAQEGAYTRLLAYCWDSGDCSLPDDDQELAVLSRLGEGWLNGASNLVRKCFVPHPSKPGYLTNERLLEEAAKQGAWKQKSSEGGKKSAAIRAEKKSHSKGGSKMVEPQPNRPLEPNGNIASASPSPSATDSDTEVSSPPPTPKKAKVSLEELSVDHIASWLAEKRTQGRYVHHDEHFVLDQFKNYCQSKGKKYADYIAGYRNAFEWERCQPKIGTGNQQGRTVPQSKWIAEGERLAAKYRAEAECDRQGAIDHNAG